MTSVLPKFSAGGPITMAALEPIDGGQLTEYAAGGVKVATAGSTVVAGVAQKPAAPGGADARVTSETGVLDTTLLPDDTVVYTVESGHTIKVKFEAAATHGQKLVAAANGAVAPGEAAGQIVGRCAEPDGVAAGGFGQIRLSRA